jgi:hypothetical protein
MRHTLKAFIRTGRKWQEIPLLEVQFETVDDLLRYIKFQYKNPEVRLEWINVPA